MQQQSSPTVAIENTGKEAVARLEEKGNELIKLLAAGAEKAMQRREEEALQSLRSDLDGQLKATVDTIQALIRQASDQQGPSLHDAVMAIQRAVAEQLQRNDEQLGPRAVEKAGEKVITLLERKGEEFVKSMMQQTENVAQRIVESVDRGVAENMAQRMEDICQGWKEILADHKETAAGTSRGQLQSEQGLSSLQEIDELRTQLDIRITSEIKTIKDTIAAQSQTLNTIKDAAVAQFQILNTILQQIQKSYQEQRIHALRSAHPMLSDGNGSNSSDRLSPVNLRSFRSPQAIPQGVQDSLSSRHAVELSIISPSVTALARQGGTTAQLDTMRRDDTHDADIQIVQHQNGAPTAASLPNNVATSIQAATSSSTTETTVATTTKAKSAHKRKVVYGPTSSTTGTEVQILESAEGSASLALSALPRGKQAKQPTAIVPGAKQQTLVTTGVSGTHALSAIAKGKKVSRREPLPPQTIDSTAENLRDHTGLFDSSSTMTVNESTFFLTDSSALSSPSSSALSSASIQNASELAHMNASAERGGGYIVIQGLSELAGVRMVPKLPRGRPRKNPDKRVLSQGPSTPAASKRRKLAANLAPTPARASPSAPAPARTYAPSRRALSEHSYARRSNITAISQDSNIMIKAEDVVTLTPRLTRTARMKLRPDSTFLDLDSVKKQVEEAGGAWRY
ncbi:hypothetical protein BGZ95_004840 [Linnemannia exigua]|uniref:Uncharacterized protein n=1 Tax=Linnemannia exigua TaxID=604196 RepID=A0AAD4DHI7_9FUNG|nr:hypothetical protein BGZ95_004840 [Linnemannia exigua]